MSDITLTVSAPGPTVELAADAPGAVTVTVNEGGGVSTHAGLPDLATSGHPVSAITGALSAAAAAAAYQPLDADLTAIAALSSPATSITNAVPKTLVDAAGDLLVGSAADTLARLPLGSASQVLRVNAGGTGLEYGTPAAAGPLAVTQYDPSSTVAHSTTSATAVDIDASNLAVTFTVPASGAVLVSLNALFRQSSETWLGGWSLREGTSEVAAAYSVMEGWTAAPTGVHQSNKRLTYRRKFTGLTPGASLTWKWAAKTSGGMSTTTYGLSGGGQPAVMEVWAA